MPTTQPRTPLAELLFRARKSQRLSQRQAANRAGISEARWRQVEAGYETVSAGVRSPANPKPDTLAYMAAAVGITPDQLTGAGREDAALELAGMLRRKAAAPPAVLRPGPGDAALPMDSAFQDQAEPHYTQIAGAVLRARAEHWELPAGAPLEGKWVFPSDAVSASQWDSLAARGWSDWQLSWAMAALAVIEGEQDRTAARR